MEGWQDVAPLCGDVGSLLLPGVSWTGLRRLVQVVPLMQPSGSSGGRAGHHMNRSELAELPPTITVMQLGRV